MNAADDESVTLLTAGIEARVWRLGLLILPLLAASPFLFNIWARPSADGIAPKVVVSVITLTYAFALSTGPNLLYILGLTRLAAALSRRGFPHIGLALLVSGAASGGVAGVAVGALISSRMSEDAPMLVLLCIFGFSGLAAGCAGAVLLYALLRHPVQRRLRPTRRST